MQRLVVTILLIASAVFCDVTVTLTNIAQGGPDTSRLNILVYQTPTDGLVQNAYVGLFASKVLNSGDTMEFTVPDSFTVQGTDKLSSVKSWTPAHEFHYGEAALVSNANGGLSLTVDPSHDDYPPPDNVGNVRVYNAKDSQTQLGYGLFKQVLGKNLFVVGRDRIRAGDYADMRIKNMLYFVESDELTLGEIVSLETRSGKDWPVDISTCDSKHYALNVTADPDSGKVTFSDPSCVKTSVSDEYNPTKIVRSCQISVNEDDAGGLDFSTAGCTVPNLRLVFKKTPVQPEGGKCSGCCSSHQGLNKGTNPCKCKDGTLAGATCTDCC